MGFFDNTDVTSEIILKVS